MLRALLIAAVGLLALLAWREDLPDVEIRLQQRTTQAGRIFGGHPLGQGFRCEHDGLRALDVALAPIGGDARAIELELRRGGPEGELVRRAQIEAAALPASDGWARFEFEPLEDSAGQEFHFALACEDRNAHSPWVRYRGVPYVVRPWGDRALEGSVVEGELLPAPPRARTDLHHGDLHTLAFATNYVHPQAGVMTLTLSDASTGDVLRTASVGPGVPCDTGWTFFHFETLADTRWRALHFKVELPTGASLIGNAEGPSIVAYHGGSQVPDDVLGATCAGAALPQRDLVFRAWSSSTRSALLARLRERGGERILWAALAWFLALVVASRLLGRPVEERE